MESGRRVSSGSNKMVWTGRILSGLLVLFMIFSSAIGLLKPAFAKAGFARLGYPESVASGVAIAMLACTLLYAIPQTSLLGAILITGYLGGATASHLRVGEPFYLPVIIGVLFWLGIYLREERLRALVPLRK